MYSNHIAPAGEIQARPQTYEQGTDVPLTACKADPRFSYALYVPPTVGPETDVLVVVHGSGRNVDACIGSFRDFGLWRNAVVLAPLFPVGIDGDAAGAGYKLLHHEGVRYANVLLSMFDEVRSAYGLEAEKFGLHGYSGGGQFAHRFALIHPDKLWAVCIGAPGQVTLLDSSLDYWPGTGGIETILGRPVDLPGLRDVPVHLVIGTHDTDTSDITMTREDPTWILGADAAGLMRIDRIESLRRSFAAAGVSSTIDYVQGVAHDEQRLSGHAKSFLSKTLAQRQNPNY